jgi:hypothetical protein
LKLLFLVFVSFRLILSALYERFYVLDPEINFTS